MKDLDRHRDPSPVGEFQRAPAGLAEAEIAEYAQKAPHMNFGPALRKARIDALRFAAIRACEHDQDSW